MKLVFGLIGALLMMTFLAGVVLKVPEPALVVVMVIGIVMMVVDLWQARSEADT